MLQAAFRRSLEYDDTHVGRIHLIHSLALSGQIEEARTTLATLSPGKIDPNLRLEYFAAEALSRSLATIPIWARKSSKVCAPSRCRLRSGKHSETNS